MAIDWGAVSARINGLVSVGGEIDFPRVAQRIGVSEQQLRDAVNDRSRIASLYVLGAIVRTFGLDPSWALTGVYDSDTHRAALAGDRAEIDELLKRLVSEHGRQPSRPTPPESMPG